MPAPPPMLSCTLSEIDGTGVKSGVAPATAALRTSETMLPTLTPVPELPPSLWPADVAA